MDRPFAILRLGIEKKLRKKEEKTLVDHNDTFIECVPLIASITDSLS